MYNIILDEFTGLVNSVNGGKLNYEVEHSQLRFSKYPKPTTWLKSFPVIAYLFDRCIDIDLCSIDSTDGTVIRRFSFFNKSVSVNKCFVDSILRFFGIDKSVYDELRIADNDILKTSFSKFSFTHNEDKTCKVTMVIDGKVATRVLSKPKLLTNPDGSLRTYYFIVVDNPLSICLTAIEAVRQNKTPIIKLSKDGLFDDKVYVEAYKGFAVRFGIMLSYAAVGVSSRPAICFVDTFEHHKKIYELNKIIGDILPQSNYVYDISPHGRVTMSRCISPGPSRDARLLTLAKDKYGFHGKLLDEMWRTAAKCKVRNKPEYLTLNINSLISVPTIADAIELDRVFFSGDVQCVNKHVFEDEYVTMDKHRTYGYMALITNKCTPTAIDSNLLETTVVNVFTGAEFVSRLENVADLVTTFLTAGGVVLPDNGCKNKYFDESKYGKIIGIILNKQGYINVASMRNNLSTHDNHRKFMGELNSYLRSSLIPKEKLKIKQVNSHTVKVSILVT